MANNLHSVRPQTDNKRTDTQTNEELIVMYTAQAKELLRDGREELYRMLMEKVKELKGEQAR